MNFKAKNITILSILLSLFQVSLATQKDNRIAIGSHSTYKKDVEIKNVCIETQQAQEVNIGSNLKLKKGHVVIKGINVVIGNNGYGEGPINIGSNINQPFSSEKNTKKIDQKSKTKQTKLATETNLVGNYCENIPNNNNLTVYTLIRKESQNNSPISAVHYEFRKDFNVEQSSRDIYIVDPTKPLRYLAVSNKTQGPLPFFT